MTDENHGQQLDTEPNIIETQPKSNFNLQLRNDLYQQMIAKSHFDPNQVDKVLEPGALNDFLNKEPFAFEKQAISIQHKSSQLNMDSTGLVKIAKCKASWYNKIQNYFFLLKDLRQQS